MQTNFLTKSFQTWKLHFNALLVSGHEAKCKIISKTKLFRSGILLCRGRQRSKCFTSPLHGGRYEGTRATVERGPLPHPRLLAPWAATPSAAWVEPLWAETRLRGLASLG